MEGVGPGARLSQRIETPTAVYEAIHCGEAYDRMKHAPMVINAAIFQGQMDMGVTG